MAAIPITHVRHSAAEAMELLKFYLLASAFNSLRPPRGIAPEQVAGYLFSTMKPESPAFSWQRALEAMRFYELANLAPFVQSLLTGREQAYEDVRRSAFMLQALADLGTATEAAWAAQYFDRVLLAKPGFAEAADLLLVTRLALAPYGSSSAFAERVRIGIAEKRGTQAGGNLQEIQENRLPALAYLSAGKQRLLTTAPVQRDGELVSIYLGDSDLSHPYLVTWAARLLRRDAGAGVNAPAILATFGHVLDSTFGDEEQVTIVQAAQAIIYLQGRLTSAQLARYEASHPEQTSGFLWDDLDLHPATDRR